VPSTTTPGLSRSRWSRRDERHRTHGHGGLPDNRHEVEDVIAEGDKIVARVTLTGTHEGEFMGLPLRVGG
jgi:predicted ester cyclase